MEVPKQRIPSERHPIDQNAAEDINQTEALIHHVSFALRRNDFDHLCTSLGKVRDQLLHLVPGRGTRDKDHFRHANGFEAVAEILHALDIGASLFDEVSLERQLNDLLLPMLQILSSAFFEHNGNRSYFTSKLDPSGWVTLQSAISRIAESDKISACTSCNDQAHDEDEEEEPLKLLRHLFKQLFAFALSGPNDDPIHTMDSSFVIISDDGSDSHVLPQPCEMKLHSPQALTIIFRTWSSTYSKHCASAPAYNSLSRSILSALADVVDRSNGKSNIVAAQDQSLSRAVLNTLLETTLHPPSPMVEDSLRALYLELIDFGPADIEEAARLFRATYKNEDITQVILDSIPERDDAQVSHFEFDNTRRGYASLELPETNGVFPPDPSQGYTLMCWVNVEQFDSRCHTTLFGAFDAGQTTFVLVYIEAKTRQLVLQTSAVQASTGRGSSPSVRFKSCVFETGIWYNIALVQRRTSKDMNTRAELYVNGVLREQVRCHYPDAARNTRRPTMQSPASNNDSSAPIIPVQAFFGTPEDLAVNSKEGAVVSKWSMATAYLFATGLPKDLFVVYHKLGPHYYGNFQDCLGSFQTYQTSAELNLGHESVQKTNTQSVISSAIRSKASRLNAERNILIGLCAHTMHETLRHSSDRVYRRSSVRNKAPDNRIVSNELVWNMAIPSVSNAVKNPSGRAFLMGDVLAYRPFKMTDIYWRLSGCAGPALLLVHRAKTAAGLLRAVKIFCRLIHNSWRNSEIMERGNGYAVLAWLLRIKFESQDELIENASKTNIVREENDLSRPPAKSARAFPQLEILQVILGFVGFKQDSPLTSLIINPLAYRALIVDCDIWRKGSEDTQRLFYNQFSAFGRQNEHWTFNSERLGRMRVIRRFLDAFKSDGIAASTMPSMLSAFETLLSCTMSADILRSLALFITFGLQEAETVAPKVAESTKADLPDNGLETDHVTLNIVSRKVIAIELLQMFANLLCSRAADSLVKKFMRTVTNKWLLHLFVFQDTRVVTPALRILSRLLAAGGEAYVLKFIEQNKGFIILERRLGIFWNVDQVWTCCFTILLGIDITDIDVDTPFNAHYIVDKIDPEARDAVPCPHMLHILLRLLDQGMKHQKNENGNENHMLLLSAIDLFLLLWQDLKKFRDLLSSTNFIKNCFGLLLNVLLSETSPAPHGNSVLEDRIMPGEIIRPRTGTNASLWSRSSRSSMTSTNPANNTRNLRRASSFVLLDETNTNDLDGSPFVEPLRPFVLLSPGPNLASGLPSAIVDLLIVGCIERILFGKEFSGLGLFLKVPEAPSSHRAFLTTHILTEILTRLEQEVSSSSEALLSTTALTNLARFTTQTCEGVFEGWLLDAAYPLLRFVAILLQYLSRQDIRQVKTVRLCSPSLTIMQALCRRLVLFQLAKASPTQVPDEQFLLDLVSWHDMLFYHSATQDDAFVSALCYLVYRKLIDESETIQLLALTFLRTLTTTKPSEIYMAIADARISQNKSHGRDLAMRLRDQPDSVPGWVKENRSDLDLLFEHSPKAALTRIACDEKESSLKSATLRLAKRNERLEQWHLEEVATEHAWLEHEASTKTWNENIYASEIFKHRRTLQDAQDSEKHCRLVFAKHERRLRDIGLLTKESTVKPKWALDQIETFDRKRIRLTPSYWAAKVSYQPKGSKKDTVTIPGKAKVDSATSVGITKPMADQVKETPLREHGENSIGNEDYEVVEASRQDEIEEDKNRKIMRSLQRGEQVLNVHNISKVAGLDAREGLLIIGKTAMYLIDHYFQRSDGEVVSTWDAPEEEKDPYTHLISGRDSSGIRAEELLDEEQEASHFSWQNVVGVSKRQFLLRNVAVEVFFQDGRSYLLTAHSPTKRDLLYDDLTSRIAAQAGLRSTQVQETSWRFESLPEGRDALSSVGAKLTNVFNMGSSSPITKRWMKGELSNFQYLMLINTMAGRTFNDLTQYPVFPWVIADYTSEELDLSNPRVYRDLSKPMGCQTPDREQSFRERYKTLTEMTDHQTPSFHYGTHYSSAMIVTSYMIRLQPFTRAYLLLQGGAFDHADRMFFDIEKAWLSASSSMTDVRELTPEFYYLPEFLTNLNDYDFGQRSNGQSIENVKLPPWARGDPHIFIAKQREALESKYVSQSLNSWIDLVFGFKQRGEAAIEATNVFHYLSYQGAKDLDSITDPLERKATIGIIHNFGQTPRQVFTRPHERRGTITQTRRLDRSTDFLTRIPTPLFERPYPICRIHIDGKADKIAAYGPTQAEIPSSDGIYAEWGTTDESIRFYSTNPRTLLGLYEQPHQELITTAVFADSKTLLTASKDTTIGIWSVICSPTGVELALQGNLFGHQHPITALAVSRPLSTVLSADTSGRVLVWDLNSLTFVREVVATGPEVYCAAINSANGHILLARGAQLSLYTLNGELLVAEQQTRSIVGSASSTAAAATAPNTSTSASQSDDLLYACAFYDGAGTGTGSGTEYVEKEIVFTGHKRGVVCVWRLTADIDGVGGKCEGDAKTKGDGKTEGDGEGNGQGKGKWRLELLRRLEHVGRSTGMTVGAYLAPITALQTTDHSLYTGDEEGRVVQWTCTK